LYYPLNSLREGHWFKLICGASFQHLPAIRNLTLAYALAGADCIDVAADPAVIAAAKDALSVAEELGGEAQARGFGFSHRPLLMASLNDGDDPHFRKAAFDPILCPIDCPRPCEKICPAQAIVFPDSGELTPEDRGSNVSARVSSNNKGSHFQIGNAQISLGKPNPERKDGFSGVIDQRCYGCGRCLPICPSQLIYTRSYVSAPEAIAQIVLQDDVDALEIHTQVGHFSDFQRLWKAITPWIDKLKLLAISCPDGEGLIDYLRSLHEAIAPLPCPLVWQTDGRPMSGDIGAGTTRAAVKLSQKVLAADLPGYVQLAGGTNDRTVMKLKAAGLLNHLSRGNPDPTFRALPVLEETPQTQRSQIHKSKSYVAGVAYGSYARVLLLPILEELEKGNGEALDTNLALLKSPSLTRLEEIPTLLWQAVASAHTLVSQLKPSQNLLPLTPN
jgi:Fe-S-cluster-containing hydrogenase component 2